ncbi:TIM barrel protein [Corynebacterium hansenii]|uniref:TIM barrel protein n=1 Tax=Corynebacterium hansenii TaxID=394964 RepID=A0ABV7ZTD3_9CORY|nr:TIM barrel protein [Corynebacterium hansenii]WJY99670.1 Hydroxypyruvate isomerase [Corynebacterium hansenii]
MTPADHVARTDHVANCSILFPGRTPAEAARAAADAGYRDVEFWWPFPVEEPSQSDVDGFAEALRSAGVRLIAVNLWGGDMAAGERGVLHERMLADGHLEAVHRLRELTGVSMGNLLPGAGGPGVSEAQRRHLRETVAALPGFTPLIEPLSGNPDLPVRDPWTAVELCRETGAGLLLDFFHLAELGVDVGAWLDDVAAGEQPLPHHVQIADSPGRGAPGTGEAPIGEWLGRLRELGYAGRVADEWVGERRPGA